MDRGDRAVKRVVLLGASGSIGVQTLDVIRQHDDKLQLVGVAVHTSCDVALSACREFGCRQVAVGDESRREDPAVAEMREMGAEIAFGSAAVRDLALMDGADVVVNALVGAAGLEASYMTLRAGRQLALANKESLVVGGELLMPLAHENPGLLLPIDSEHGAIFQCLVGEDPTEVARLWVTASGGPFRGMKRDQLSSVTRADALAHPTWNMGPKITIDSASLMNKGLEVIEAHHLFDMEFDRIEVVVHPQSCIHSMVEYIDGSVKAHLGVTDMRIPIQYSLSYPERWAAPVPPADFREHAPLTFDAPDMETFRCLALAIEAGRTGGTAPAVMNAANEVAVATFLADRCRFTDIDETVEATLAAHDVRPVESLEQLTAVDAWARSYARERLQKTSA